MSPFITMGAIFALLLWLVLLFFAIKNKGKYSEVEKFIAANKESKIWTFNYEQKFLNRYHIPAEKAVKFLWVERGLILTVVLAFFLALKGLGLSLCGAVLAVIFFDDLYQKTLYKSGVTHIENVVNFIDYFIPHITSGNSADQSFLSYIEYSKDSELAQYFAQKDDLEVKIPPHLKQIIEIYSISKYNEDKGINDYVYILEEISRDISQKQVYYNSFIARIGEIKPIMWSYYIGVPILIAISYGNTYTFWQGGGGYVVSLVLLALFALFKFLIYKLQEKTIKTIF